MTDGIIWPGDEIGGYTVQRLIAYQGKDDCMDVRCRRRSLTEPGCMGYHCPGCDEPVSMMGHDCPKLRVND